MDGMDDGDMFDPKLTEDMMSYLNQVRDLFFLICVNHKCFVTTY